MAKLKRARSVWISTLISASEGAHNAISLALMTATDP